MNGVKNLSVTARLISPPGEHFFFGYYDVQPWDGQGKRHLALKTSFFDRLPETGEKAILGFLDPETAGFTPLTATNAWNFQQGCMARWMPEKTDTEIIYNAGNKEDTSSPYFRSVVHNIETGSVRYLSKAVADLSPDGAAAAGINFSRLFDFRPGYGYPGVPDPYAGIAHPKEDGIFIIDTESGSSRLILSYPALRDFVRKQRGKAGREMKKLVINHINFSPAGDRLVFICRDFPEEGEIWGNSFFSVNTDGSGLYCLSDFGLVSHYVWRDPLNILAYADGHSSDWGLYLYTDRSRDAVEIDHGFFTADGHCSYSPCGRYILYDSYPRDDGYRYLYIYNLEEKLGRTLGGFYSDPRAVSDWRCDLHPRWNRDGRCITFDSTHEGFRGVYLINTDEITW